MRSAAIAVLVAVAVLALVLFTAGDGPSDEPIPVLVGFNDNAVTQGVASPEQVADLLARVGADVDRVQINWEAIEPVRGEYDFRTYDAIYEADLARGVKPLFIFAFAPAWAAPDAPCDPRVPTCHVPPSPEHYDDAARTAAVIARRYPRAIGIEIWNEPNTSYFWAPQPDPTAYGELLAASYEAIKRAAPSMTVAGAATASGTGSSSMPAPDFIRALLADGRADSLDVLSMHAYPVAGDATGTSAAAAAGEIAALLEEAGSDAPIWVTETGASVTGPTPVTDEGQAATTVGLVRELGGVDAVEMVLIHTLIRTAGDPASPEGGFGIVGTDLAPAPAFCALSEQWGGEPC